MKIAVLVLSYNDQCHLEECYRALEIQTHPCKLFHINNASPDDGVAFVRQHFPAVNVIDLPNNYGYAGAYNRVFPICFEAAPGNLFDAVLLLNSDTKVEPDCVECLVRAYEEKRANGEIKIGLIQPAVLLYEQPNVVNTIGNAMHYLGFGFCKGLGKPFERDRSVHEIVSVSGSALFVSRDYWKMIGSLDETFFMYNEDQNYSWRGLLKDFVHYCVHDAVVYHKYSFSFSHLRWFNSEKNRWMMLLQNFEWKTLIVFLPMLVFMEVVLLAHSIKEGWFKAKINSYWYLFVHFRRIYQSRVQIQGAREAPDSKILLKFDREISFGPVTTGLGEKLVNKILDSFAGFAFWLLSVGK